MVAYTLGECYCWESKDDQAVSVLRQALAIDQHNGPDFGPEVRNYLALALERKGDFDQARQLLQQAVDMSRRTERVNSPSYAVMVSNLGSALIDRVDLSGAQTTSRESLAIRRKIFSPRHPDLVYSLNNLGYVLFGLGRPAISRRPRRSPSPLTRTQRK